MQCLFLFRDSEGRLPTAKDLRRCGFCVSKAALTARDVSDERPVPVGAPASRGPAPAAEPRAVSSGEAVPRECETDSCPGEYGA